MTNLSSKINLSPPKEVPDAILLIHHIPNCLEPKATRDGVYREIRCHELQTFPRHSRNNEITHAPFPNIICCHNTNSDFRPAYHA
ncbi:MAG: hypothetical protein ACOH2E_05235 [Candidatus Paracaedibacter sp.]